MIYLYVIAICVFLFVCLATPAALLVWKPKLSLKACKKCGLKPGLCYTISSGTDTSHPEYTHYFQFQGHTRYRPSKPLRRFHRSS